MRNDSSSIRVYYRPIEAAIRWSGLTRHEPEILAALKGRNVPKPADFPQWPSLRLNAERILDAIANGELPSGIDGTTVQKQRSLTSPRLTVRHVDLKAWLSRYYPDERPGFLFSSLERELAHPFITIESVRYLLAERDALKANAERLVAELAEVQQQNKKARRIASSSDRGSRTHELGERADTTYLHIIGGLVGLLLGRTPSGQPYSSFKTQEAVISALIAHHRGRLGISERTLRAKFAEARRRLPLD